MKLKAIMSAVISGIVICIKRLPTYNRAIKAIDRKAYDIHIEEEYSLLVEMYSNHLFAQLLDCAFWSDLRSGRLRYKKKNSFFTLTERNIANYYLIWKEEQNEKKNKM